MSLQRNPFQPNRQLLLLRHLQRRRHHRHRHRPQTRRRRTEQGSLPTLSL